MKRLLVLAMVLAAAAVACTGGEAVSLGKAPSPSPSAGGSTAGSSPSPTPSAGLTPSPVATGTGHPYTYRLWFVRGGALFETRRTEPFTPGIGRLAMTRLLQGPSPAETAASVGTDIPVGTTLLDLSIANAVATVDLSGPFGANAPSPSTTLRVAQVVYTLTQFSTVRSVAFRIDGQTATVVAGLPMDRPQTAAMYARELPAILVESPMIGARVGSPVGVGGTANVFEARVTVRVLDANGREIARTFTQASCGTGCRGTFEVTVRYRVATDQAGTIEVFEASPKDGSPEHLQAIPVTLTA